MDFERALEDFAARREGLRRVRAAGLRGGDVVVPDVRDGDVGDAVYAGEVSVVD